MEKQLMSKLKTFPSEQQEHHCFLKKKNCENWPQMTHSKALVMKMLLSRKRLRSNSLWCGLCALICFSITFWLGHLNLMDVDSYILLIMSWASSVLLIMSWTSYLFLIVSWPHKSPEPHRPRNSEIQIVDSNDLGVIAGSPLFYPDAAKCEV